MRRWARVWWLVDLTRLYHRTSFLFSATKPESWDGPNIRREEDLRPSRVLSCGGGKWRGSTREGGRGSSPNSGRFYPYPLLSPEGPLFKSHMPSGALTADDKVPLFCFVPFCSTARIISAVSKHTFSLNWVATQNMAFYKITKIVRALWLAESSVCMRVCKHGCGVKLLAFRELTRKHEFEKVFEFKTRQVYFIYPFLRRLKHGKSSQRRRVNFSSLKLTF